MCFENEKYYVQPLRAEDAEEVKTIVRENRYFARLFDNERLAKDMNDIVQKVFIDREGTHGIYCKEDDSFLGFIEIDLQDNEEGEFAVRLKDEMEIKEILSLFEKMLEQSGHNRGRYLNIEYSFD